MNKILLFFTLLSTTLFGQVPSNDCANAPTIINNCGTSFSVSQSQMSFATADAGCAAGGTCPIVYVNGTGYSNFDCDATTSPAGAGGDDWDGSVENSLFWQFTPTQSCTYNITIIASNCCCKDKGPSNAAQFQIYRISANLPGGTINQYYGGNSGFVGTITTAITTVANQPVLIAVDGVNGSDCDISVSISPQASCTGCNILPIELLNFNVIQNKDFNNIKWSCATEINNNYFILERSLDGINFYDLIKLNGAGNSVNTTNYSYNDFTFEHTINYYRLKQVDFNGEFKYFNIVSIDNSLNNTELTVVKRINTLGQDVDDDYEGIYIEIYNNGTVKRKCCAIIKQQ